uniref:Putative secreted protein n=1 Tax=Anopheles triannulatus TaxID=58253 RepID=A0A2M4B4R1_9DIPT
MGRWVAPLPLLIHLHTGAVGSIDADGLGWGDRAHPPPQFLKSRSSTWPKEPLLRFMRSVARFDGDGSAAAASLTVAAPHHLTRLVR